VLHPSEHHLNMSLTCGFWLNPQVSESPRSNNLMTI
jgi:hypothetical protein